MIVFEGNRGAVVRLDDPAAQANIQFVSVSDPSAGFNSNDADITFSSQRSIVTRLTISQRANVQFLHTVGQNIYIYVFGDRIGQITLSGLSFNAACVATVDPGVIGNTTTTGAERMLAWYKNYRVSKQAGPLRVSIGRTVIEGFVIDFHEDVIDPESGLVQWGVDMSTLPDLV